MRNKQFRLVSSRYTHILFASASVLLVVFAILTILPPANPDLIASAVIDSTVYDLTLTTSNSINLELTPTSEGSVAIAKDTVTATTASPSGYKLYVSTNSTSDNNIYLNGNDENNTDDKVIKGTTGTYDSPLALNTNNDNNIYASWGYAVAGLNNFDNTYSTTSPSSSSKFAALPTKNNEQLIHEHTGIAEEDTTNIYYGVKANTNLAAGNYQTEILYTTLTDTSSIVDGEATITPNELEEGYEAQTATIQTSLKTTRELGTISVTIGDQACTDVTVTSESPVTLTCTVPAGLNIGSYNVQINFASLGKSYIIASGLTISKVTVICNPLATTIAEAVCMQDMNADIMASMTLEQQYRLYDSRDEKPYFIAKLADGKVWMTQNLDLNLSTDITLTNADTDLNSVESWEPPVSTVKATSNKTTTGIARESFSDWLHIGWFPSSLDPGDVYFDGEYFESEGCNYLSTNCEHFKNTPQSNGKHGHIGNYYNWSAAVASEDTSGFTTGGNHPDSICPKGWRLPQFDINNTDGDFKTLYNTYNTDDTDSALISSPLYFVRGGRIAWSPGVLGSAGEYGVYWSSTVLSSNFVKQLNHRSSIISFGSGAYTYGGQSVRCIAREPEPEPLSAFDQAFSDAGKTKQDGYYKMQDMTSDICAAVPTPTDDRQTTYTSLIDTRDNKVYAVAKYMDGNCWMKQDLELGNNTQTYELDSSNSNLASGQTFTMPTIQSTNNEYTWEIATAGTGTQDMASGNTTSSICPKGWRLPSGTNSGEFYTLIDLYGSSTYYSILTFGGGRGDYDDYAYWWSNTIANSSSVYTLEAYKDGDYQANFKTDKSSSAYIRCMAAN